jgi:hypothetical protein
MADAKADTRMADDKKRLAADREAREKAAEERAKTRGRPTPTQEECDLAALGHAVDLSPDGSPEEKPAGHQTRQVESGGGAAGYQTRQSAPQPHASKTSSEKTEKSSA